MVADEKRNIVLVNKMFCNMFDISASPEKLTGFPCALMNEQNKHLFKSPYKFINDTDEVFKKKQPCVGYTLELADGRIFRREYVPLFIDNKYAGYFWKYSDITLQQVLEQQLRESKQDAEQSPVLKKCFLQI